MLFIVHTHTELHSSEEGVGLPPLIASELKEMRLTQLELNCKLQQSLQLQEMKSSLQLLERSVKILSEKSDKRSTDADVIDADSLLSSFGSNPPPSESSCTSASLPPAFGSPPLFSSPPSFGSPVLGPASPSSNFHPMIPSLSGKQMRANSAPPTYRYFQQDCHGGASCWSGDSYPQSSGVLELEGGIPSTRDETWPVVMGTTQL